MKRSLMTSLLALMLLPPAFVQGAAPAPSSALAQSSAPAAEELTRILREFLDGASRNDVAAHERFWADDLIYTRSAGVRVSKADILENARSGPNTTAPSPTKYSAENIRIQQYGDTAVVAFRLVGTTAGAGTSEVMQFLNTGTFVKRDGQWRVVAWQSTRVPGAKDECATPQSR